MKSLTILLQALTQPFVALKRAGGSFEVSYFIAGLMSVVLAGCGLAIGLALMNGHLVGFVGLLVKILAESSMILIILLFLSLVVHALASAKGKTGAYLSLLSWFLLSSMPLFLLLPTSIIAVSIEEFTDYPVLAMFLFVFSLLLIIGFVIVLLSRVITVLYGFSASFHGFLVLAVSVFIWVLVEISVLVMTFFRILSPILNALDI